MMVKKKVEVETTVRCSECGEEARSTDSLSDCFECANVTDACEPCIQDHMAEQHDNLDED
jgi:formylmethanofuran dehydrogenase subunit E